MHLPEDEGGCPCLSRLLAACVGGYATVIEVLRLRFCGACRKCLFQPESSYPSSGSRHSIACLPWPGADQAGKWRCCSATLWPTCKRTFCIHKACLPTKPAYPSPPILKEGCQTETVLTGMGTFRQVCLSYCPAQQCNRQKGITVRKPASCQDSSLRRRAHYHHCHQVCTWVWVPPRRSLL